MINTTLGYLDVTIAVIGLLQGGFLCLLLRSEGVRAFAANRWMILFLCCLMINLLADIGDNFSSEQVRDLIVLFSFPCNFLIGPSIYLYFRELSGTPERAPWVHFLLPALVLNLLVVLFAVDGLSGEASVGSLAFLIEGIKGLCWVAIFLQACFYIYQLWMLSQVYFRQVQQQLGVGRRVIQRWVFVIFGGVCLIFVTVFVSRVVAFYIPEQMAMTGTGVAFVLVLFAMSYVIATQPALFVMADWPENIKRSAIADGVFDNKRAQDQENGMGVGVATSSEAARSLLDEDALQRALTKLAEIRSRRELLLDPLVSLPKLSRAVGVSPNQLSYVLNRHLGQNFFDYVNSARIEEARAVLVLEPERTVLDIALSVGFNSKSTFNLAFKKITGETPSAVREAARSGTTLAADASEQPFAGPNQQHWTPKIG